MSIQNYGQHPTRYSKQSDGEFYANFRASHWQELDNDERLDALQEAINRSAASHGEIGACRVQWGDDLSAGTYAQQGGDYITINPDRFMQRTDTDYRGRPMEDAGMKALEAALHEDEHAYQNQVIADVIDAPNEDLKRQYKANDVVAIPMENGTYGSSYLKSHSVDYYMYYFQSTERDAFRNSQARSREIMREQVSLIQQEMARTRDPETFVKAAQDLKAYAAYADSLASSGYYARLNEAQKLYVSESFEQDLNTALTNIYYNEKQPLVQEDMQESVAAAMKISYSPHQRIDYQHGAGAQNNRNNLLARTTGDNLTIGVLQHGNTSYNVDTALDANTLFTADAPLDLSTTHDFETSHDAGTTHAADASSAAGMSSSMGASNDSGISYDI